jgi:hypothetical protein
MKIVAVVIVIAIFGGIAYFVYYGLQTPAAAQSIVTNLNIPLTPQQIGKQILKSSTNAQAEAAAPAVKVSAGPAIMKVA